MQIKIKVDDKQTRKALKNIGSKIEGVLDNTMGDIADDIKKEAVHKAPKGKGPKAGTLKRSIKTDKKGKMHYEVVADTPYAAAVEHGTKPRTIRAKRSKVLATNRSPLPPGFKVNGRGYVVFGQEVQHPGTRPQPYMDPALRKVEKNVPKKIIKEINDLIQKSVRKH